MIHHPDSPRIMPIHRAGAKAKVPLRRERRSCPQRSQQLYVRMEQKVGLNQSIFSNETMNMEV